MTGSEDKIFEVFRLDWKVVYKVPDSGNVFVLRAESGKG